MKVPEEEEAVKNGYAKKHKRGSFLTCCRCISIYAVAGEGL